MTPHSDKRFDTVQDRVMQWRRCNQPFINQSETLS